jgi:thiol-disulfide isomerase/thioredoxin
MVLIDFWSIYCSYCIASMPKIWSLQKEFRGRLSILMVTSDSESKVSNFWKTHKLNPEIAAAKDHLLFINGDTSLTELFPHPSIPLHIWIDSGLRYYCSAYDFTTNKKNILSRLNRKQIELAEQRILPLDFTKPLTWYQSYGEVTQDLTGYSLFGKRIEYGGAGNEFQAITKDSISGNLLSFKSVNISLRELYKIAYSDILPSIPYNRMYIDCRDSDRFFQPDNKDQYFPWAEQNIFCYAFSLPAKSGIDGFNFMRNDLDRYFSIKTTWKKKLVKCLVLKDNSKNIRSSEDIKKNYNGGTYIVKSEPIKAFAITLEQLLFKRFKYYPIISDSHVASVSNIILPEAFSTDYNDLGKVKKALQLNGFDIDFTYRTLNMLVFEDN